MTSGNSFIRLQHLLVLSVFLTYGVTQNFQATYGSSPAPFIIDVDVDFIQETRLKALLTRYLQDIVQPDLIDGPPRHNVTTVRDYWVNDYDWATTQDQLNARHFTSLSPLSSR